MHTADRTTILIMYVKSKRFFWDLLSSVPWDLMIRREDTFGPVHFCVGMLRYLRIQIVMAFFSLKESDVRTNYAFVRIARFFFVVTAEAHL